MEKDDDREFFGGVFVIFRGKKLPVSSGVSDGVDIDRGECSISCRYLQD